MGGQRVHAAMGSAAEGEIEALRRGLGRDRIPVPAYQTLGIEMRSVEAGAAVARMPASPYLTAPGRPAPRRVRGGRGRLLRRRHPDGVSRASAAGTARAPRRSAR
jgi:hypothetical protein